MTERGRAWRGLVVVWGWILLLGLLAAARADSTVVFSEVMYHPAEDGTPEWIELHNQMAVTMDLSGWSVQGGIDYTFPPGTILKGGAYLVLAAAPEELQAITGLYGVYGPFTGKLSNSGESLRLVSHNERLMDRLDYDDRGDWPVA